MFWQNSRNVQISDFRMAKMSNFLKVNPLSTHYFSQPWLIFGDN